MSTAGIRSFQKSPRAETQLLAAARPPGTLGNVRSKEVKSSGPSASVLAVLTSLPAGQCPACCHMQIWSPEALAGKATPCAMDREGSGLLGSHRHGHDPDLCELPGFPWCLVYIGSGHQKAVDPGRPEASLCLTLQGTVWHHMHRALGQACPGCSRPGWGLEHQARTVEWLVMCRGPGMAWDSVVQDVAQVGLKFWKGPPAHPVWPRLPAPEEGPGAGGNAGSQLWTLWHYGPPPSQPVPQLGSLLPSVI